MGVLTLLIGALAIAMVICLTPVYGLVVYIAALAWYRSDLAISIGTIDFTLRRIVILAIFANIFLRTNLPMRFKFIWLDKLVVIYFLCEILVGTFTAQSLTTFWENRAGAVLDTVLPYFAVRMIVQDKQQYLALLKGILVVAAPLAMIGFYQCLAGKNPLGFLQEYGAWGGSSYTPIVRNGFYRANVVFSHAIMYGLFFAMFGPVCAGVLQSVGRHRTFYSATLGLMGVGVFSSMSSGPILAGLLSILFIAIYPWRKYWKAITIIAILICGSVEIISNRHFYDVLGGFTLSPETAWYRSRLVDVALFEGGMSGHWLTGFGYDADPGWGPVLDGRNDTDMVNHYLLVLCQYGLIGLLLFLAVNVMVAKRLVDAYRVSTDSSDKWLVWYLSAALFGLWGAFMSVSLFGQPTTVYYVIMGFAGVMPTIVGSKRLAPAIS